MVLENFFFWLFLLFIVMAVILGNRPDNITILRPLSQVMFHVEFENCRSSGGTEEDVGIFFQVLTGDARRTKHTA